MAKHTSLSDPRGLISEAYNIEGITDAECRSIFLDWVLGFGISEDMTDHVNFVLGEFASDRENHPMTVVLRSALETPTSARRGGRSGRRRNVH